MPTSVMSKRSNRTRNRTGAVIAALSLALLAALAAPTAASAHTGTLGVTSVCATDGTRQVTYSGSTTSVPSTGAGHVAALTVTDLAPAGATVSPPTQTIVGDADYTVTEILPGDATSAAATASLVWGDGAVSDPNGEVTFATACAISYPTPVKDASASVATTPATCATPGSAGFTIENASWNDAADTTDGSRVATAATGHLFSDGSATATVTYAIAPASGANTAACATARVTTRSSDLANTGVSDDTGYIAMGAVLTMLAGAGILLAARRRSRRSGS